MERQQEYVLRTVEERGVRFIQLWFTDVLGTPKAFNITPAELENALSDGMTFDGSAIEGFSREQESDMLARPDATTFQILPQTGGEAPVARVLCDITNLDGTPFEGSPRNVLRGAIERARLAGYSFFASTDLEYFYFADSSTVAPLVPLDNGSYFDLTTDDLASDLRRRTVLRLEDLGIPVEKSQHEDAPSQHEIDLRYTDALTMADSVMTARMVVKEIAAAAGVYATFMPKPLAGVQGSGMHTHMSLFHDELNAFHDPDDELHLSQVARQFMAGLLMHAREITAITNPCINSYKRLVVGFEAPVSVAWGRNDRRAVVNVPHPKDLRGASTRIELRSPDPACNPYLAFAVVLAAGMRGIEAGYELPPEGKSIESLPGTLAEAVDEMEGSALVVETLGEHVFEWFIRNERAEWADYKAQVTQFELDRYLPRL